MYLDQSTKGHSSVKRAHLVLVTAVIVDAIFVISDSDALVPFEFPSVFKTFCRSVNSLKEDNFTPKP